MTSLKIMTPKTILNFSFFFEHLIYETENVLRIKYDNYRQYCFISFSRYLKYHEINKGMPPTHPPPPPPQKKERKILSDITIIK